MAMTNILQARVISGGDTVRLYLIAFVLVLIAEFIGNVQFSLGPGKIVLLPLLWALLLGAGLGLAQGRLPRALRIDVALQRRSSSILQLALMLFIAKLGLLVGGSLPKLAASGLGLLFQEFGHFFGTMVLGLPVALLLGIKRQAIGATFSVGREPSLAIIGEKYGMDSPEGQGVLAEYLTGTVFGAVLIALLAGVMASLHLLDPLALAMGAGVGSGSMMAAAAGAIAAQQTPEMAKDVASFAAASNLITTTIGTYFTLFLSLPFTVWAYGVLEPLIGRTTSASRAAPAASPVADAAVGEGTGFGALDYGLAWVLVALFGLAGNWITYKTAPDAAVLGGAAIIIAVVAAGFGLYRLTGSRVPSVIFVSIIGMALTYPGLPFSELAGRLTGKINFLALATPILAFAGLSIAKDVPAFRSLGWRIVVVSLLANAGTFIGASLIAQFFLHQPG